MYNVKENSVYGANKGFASAQYICCMDAGNHIGEYIKEKLSDQGRSYTWLANRLKTTRQNLVATVFDKNELLPSKVKEIEKAVEDSEFFISFFEKNNISKFYSENNPEQIVEEKKSQYGKGYSLSIQVDPDGFDAEEMHRLVDIMAEVTRKLKR